MITREARLNWIEAQMIKADYVTTGANLDQLRDELKRDIDGALDEALISFREHDILTRRASVVIEDRRQELAPVRISA
jgi:hypothetical protein